MSVWMYTREKQGKILPFGKEEMFISCIWTCCVRGKRQGVESVTNSLITRHSNSAQTNVFHTITRLIILIPLQCHGDSERERERGERDCQKQGWRLGRGRREGKHIRLRDLQWLYISQCLVKAARQGSGNLIIV